MCSVLRICCRALRIAASVFGNGSFWRSIWFFLMSDFPKNVADDFGAVVRLELLGHPPQSNANNVPVMEF